MPGFSAKEFLSDCSEHFVIILGTNEIASAVAARLTWERRRVVLSHDAYPPVIRRGMAFHDALYGDRAEVDGVVADLTQTTLDVVDVLSRPGHVAVSPLPLTDLIPLRAPDVLIDARMQKHRVTPDLRGIAGLVIGLGPNFTAGWNCDVAIETHPAHTGELLENGATLASDGVARVLGGVGKERFIYAARDGVWRTPLDIGARVFKDYLLGRLDGLPIQAPMDGFLRGIARDGVHAARGVKLVEIDPRGRASNWTGTDERGRAIAEAVVRAIAESPAGGRRPSRTRVTLH